MTLIRVPYYSQWESRHLVADIISNVMSPQDDPLWARSGAHSIEEYALWAGHICGMACLKMALEAKSGIAHPTFDLLNQALRYGGYVQQDGDIRGMIYAPVTEMLSKEFSIRSQVVTDFDVDDIERSLMGGQLFIASVHPTIRWAECEPPKKGGHLVLVTAASNHYLQFHNPSGDCVKTQENVVMSSDDFGRYFARRGILIY